MGMFKAIGFRGRHEAPDVWRQWSGHSDPAPPRGLACPANTPIWVIYASETGVAEDLAHETQRQLNQRGRANRLIALEDVDVRSLARVDHALFLASTCGDGDAPYMAVAFERQTMQQPALLSGLNYGLLALGDRRYDDFCAFGKQLDAWLRASGARPLFEAVQMDNEDALSMGQWNDHVRKLAAHADVDTDANA